MQARLQADAEEMYDGSCKHMLVIRYVTRHLGINLVKIYVEPLLAFFPCTKALAVKTHFTSLQIVLELADAARESPDRL